MNDLNMEHGEGLELYKNGLCGLTLWLNLVVNILKILMYLFVTLKHSFILVIKIFIVKKF